MRYCSVCFVDMGCDHVERAGQDFTVLCLCCVRAGVPSGYHHTQLAYYVYGADLGTQAFSVQLRR